MNNETSVETNEFSLVLFIDIGYIYIGDERVKSIDERTSGPLERTKGGPLANCSVRSNGHNVSQHSPLYI